MDLGESRRCCPNTPLLHGDSALPRPSMRRNCFSRTSTCLKGSISNIQPLIIFLPSASSEYSAASDYIQPITLDGGTQCHARSSPLVPKNFVKRHVLTLLIPKLPVVQRVPGFRFYSANSTSSSVAFSFADGRGGKRATPLEEDEYMSAARRLLRHSIHDFFLGCALLIHRPSRRILAHGNRRREQNCLFPRDWLLRRNFAHCARVL
ncbi:hypothetical protein K503DRAFT_799939 [Rhizopogon vinicolor AM-OR11-026]|uniref:Uncharacterized protein n=1 Tax=Rhizopogon vinicolor AM-OR11-026 TaxID=1314800 RepID=A0A1B7N2M6_9AGAM|nr:hypothetical protein K503DRAFT_799939 [Rhizopogon vinicolor AM-OR11-026]